MNIIETVRKILTDCSLMDQFNGVHIDYTDSTPGDCGLIPQGARLLGGDVCGNEKYLITFQLQSGLHAYEDADRLSNSNFLLELGYYLDHIMDIETVEKVNGSEKNAVITKMRCNNALMFFAPSGDINDGVVYQLQIEVNYTIKEE